MPRLTIPTLAVTLVLVSCGGGGGGSSGGGGGSGSSSPTASVAFSPLAVLGGGQTTATVTFSQDVTGIAADDFTVGGGTMGSLASVDARTYTLQITAGGSGTTVVDLDVRSGAGQNASGNATTAATGSAAVGHAGWATATGTDSYGVWADLALSGNGLNHTQRFRLIAPGVFSMGSPASEAGRPPVGLPYETQHQVTLTEPYWMADSECPQRLWYIITGSNPSFHQPPNIGATNYDLPVEQVSWNDIQSFLTSLNGSVAGLNAGLPTDAQWERAARAGTTSSFSLATVSRDTINSAVDVSDPYIFLGIQRDMTVACKSLPANAWGLYEVHGNVWEWCSDWWQEDLGASAATDPTGPASGTYRVKRGGAWSVVGQHARSASRDFVGQPTYSAVHHGFRLSAPAWPSGGG
jgi:sulfatase modifying factor 1